MLTPEGLTINLKEHEHPEKVFISDWSNSRDILHARAEQMDTKIVILDLTRAKVD